ncbi:MAG: YgfZ/GcvT domain-containing protein [Stellaceae bacterium]
MDRQFAIPNPGRGILEIGGPARAEFLQGLITNDTARLTAGRAIYAALLTAQGRYLHDFFVVAQGDTFLIDADATRLPDLARRLQLYKLRANVTIALASERYAIAVAFGSEALAALGLDEEPGQALAFAGGIAHIDPRRAALGARLILPRATGLAALRERGFVETRPEAYDRLRLAQGVPEGGRDLVPEKSLIMESGFDALNGIDWAKGCYIGQELTARMKYRALVKRRLMPVAIAGPAPPPGTPIRQGEAEVGEMRSALDGIGLALLRLEAVENLSTEVPLLAGTARLTPRANG